jgi:hypothetical protein
MNDDDEPTEEELRQARALARALEGEPDPDAPLEAVETAAFLRYARDGGRLDQLALRRRRPFRWPALAIVAVVAAAGLMLLVRPRPPVPPPPTAALLRAQASAARGSPGGLAALDQEMQRYRQAMFARSDR